jgi:hypothetical protein
MREDDGFKFGGSSRVQDVFVVLRRESALDIYSTGTT